MKWVEKLLASDEPPAVDVAALDGLVHDRLARGSASVWWRRLQLVLVAVGAVAYLWIAATWTNPTIASGAAGVLLMALLASFVGWWRNRRRRRQLEREGRR